VEINQSINLIASVRSTKVAEVAIDVIGRLVMQIFHDVIFGRFLHLPNAARATLCRTPITPKAFPATTIGNQ
jgi:hypothetical protein